MDYMSALRFSLNTIAQWPNAELGVRSRLARFLSFYRYVLITMGVIYLTSNIMYVKKNIQIIPFVDLGHSYANISMTVLHVQRLTLSFQKKYTTVVKTFVTEFHLKFHEHKNNFAAKEHHRINTICGIAVVIINLQMFFGILLYNLVPLINNVKAGMFSDNRPENKTFEHAIYYDLPFDQYNDTTAYLVMLIFNWFPSYCVSSTICHFDLLVFVIVFHISGHLNILKHSLNNFPRPSHEEQSTRVYNEEIFLLLKNIFTNYEMIKKFMAEVSTAFDISLCVYLLFHQIVGCVLLLECSSLEAKAVSRYGLLTLIIFQQLIQTSLIFEIIQTKSETLSDDVYALPWELMDVRNRRVVLLLLRNVQTPLAVKAGGMVPVGVCTMSAIIRTSISYFIMLQTFAV